MIGKDPTKVGSSGQLGDGVKGKLPASARWGEDPENSFFYFARPGLASNMFYDPFMINLQRSPK
jgi:hypothetical protein